MKPNKKYKLIGLLLAVILLIAAIVCKFTVGTDEAAAISLPLLCAGLWLIMIFDTLAYRTTEAEGITKRLELARLVGGIFLSVLVTVASVILLMGR